MLVSKVPLDDPVVLVVPGIDQSLDKMLEKIQRIDTTDNDLPERRRRARLQLRWAVRFSLEQDLRPIEATTLNINSDGFYCLCDVDLQPDKVLGCLLIVPNHCPEERDRNIALACRVRVVRVDYREVEPIFGIACRIEEYHLIRV